VTIIEIIGWVLIITESTTLLAIAGVLIRCMLLITHRKPIQKKHPSR
jgi:hypothetical protein